MKITKLIQMMNNSSMYEDDNHHIKIYKDGSGSINSRKKEVIGFDNTIDMQDKLTSIYYNIKGKDKNKWKL